MEILKNPKKVIVDALVDSDEDRDVSVVEAIGARFDHILFLAFGTPLVDDTQEIGTKGKKPKLKSLSK